MNNRLGIHAFVWTGSSAQRDLEAAAERSAELGFEVVEFPNLDPRQFDVAAVARRLEALGLGITMTMGLPWDGDVSSEDKAVVARGEELLTNAVAVARDLGSTKLGGIIFSAHGKYEAPPTATGRANAVAAVARVAEGAKRAGVSLNLEIVNRFETNLLNTAAQALAFIDETGSDNVFLHLDTFHMNIEEADLAAAIRLAGKKLGYFHVGESNRGYLGAGSIAFDPIFDALLDIDYDDIITFESFSSEVVDRYLSTRVAIWRNTWTDNVDLARHAKRFIDLKLEDAQRRRAVNRAG